MFMNDPSVNPNPALLPRILAEDTLTAELRSPAPVTKMKKSFFRSGWMRKSSKSNARCICNEHRPASCPGC